MPRRLAIIGPYTARVLDYEEAPLGPEEVRVKTSWASGKHGTTMAGFEGGAFAGQSFDAEMRIFLPSDQPGWGPSPERPAPAGTTGVGTVVDVGSAVETWQVGDEVFGLMDIRETNVVNQNQIWPLGDLDPELALLIEPAYVAFHAVREANVRYGDSVAVVGLGALGLLAVRMAAATGAERVFAVDPLESRRAWAAEHGADAVFDPTDGDVALAIHQATGGKGVDIAIELSGAYAGLATAMRSARVGGTICSAGFYQEEAHGLWLGREWHHNRLKMIVPHGCGWGHPPRDYPLWDSHRAYDVLASLMHQGKLTAPGLIQPVLSLDEATGIYQMIRDHPEEVIKYAVRF